MPLSDELMVAAMFGSQYDVVNGHITYQYRQIARVLRHLRGRRRYCAIDIGAHVGLWSMNITPYFERVLAFEPVKEYCDIYRFNVDMGIAEVHNVGLSNAEGKAKLRFANNGNSGRTMVLPGDGDSCQLRTLDSYGIEDCQLMKLDTEGHELKVLQGAEETIKRTRPVIVLEQNGSDATMGGRRDEGTRFLLELGMKIIVRIQPDVIFDWPEHDVVGGED